MTLVQSFSPPYGSGAAKQVERWMAARFSVCRPCESSMRRTNALCAAKRLDGASWRWYNKRAGRDDAAAELLPSVMGLEPPNSSRWMAAHFSICRPCESSMRRTNALCAAKRLDGGSWRWYNKRAGRDDACVELLPSEMDQEPPNSSRWMAARFSICRPCCSSLQPVQA